MKASGPLMIQDKWRNGGVVSHAEQDGFYFNVSTCASTDPKKGGGWWEASTLKASMIKHISILADLDHYEDLVGASVKIDGHECGKILEFNEESLFWARINCEYDKEVSKVRIESANNKPLSFCGIFVLSEPLGFTDKYDPPAEE